MGFTVTYYLPFVLLLLAQNPSLDSVSPKERQAAIEKMAVLGNHDAIPKLGEALKKEPKSDIRAEIVAALGRIRDKDALPILTDTLRSDLDKNVRSQAIDSILRLYILMEDTGHLTTIFNKVKGVLIEPNPPVVGPEVQVDTAAKEALAVAMQKDFTDEVREEAARALGSLRAKDQIPAMLAALEDPQNQEHRAVRATIVRTLGVLRDPSAGPALERALRDPDRQVVSEAVTAVGLVGDTAARPTLENIFRTSSNPPLRTISGPPLKTRALESLALLRDPANVPLFESLLDNKDDYYRELSAEGLARVKYAGAKDWGPRLDQEKKPNVRNAIAYGLAASGNIDYINNLANALDSRQAYQVEVYLYELGKFGGQLNELYRYLHSANPKVRAGMARVLGNIGDPSSADQIRPLADDPSTEVVREAVGALRKLSK
jgi:HEAT repeat protein